MLKKVFKYLGAVLGVLTCLPLFVAPFALVVKNSALEDAGTQTYGLFADLDGVSSAYKMAGKTFQSFWVTLFQIVVIVALAIAVVMFLVNILSDLKVIKGQKLEKVLATLLLVVGLVALVAIVLCSLLNTFKTEGAFTTTTTSFAGTLIGWLMPVFAVLGGVFALASAGQKTKKKRK